MELNFMKSLKMDKNVYLDILIDITYVKELIY